MKKIITIILSFFFLTTLFSQSIDNLDEKKGFKDFTLGDTYTKWQSQLTFEGNWDDGTKAYLYTGHCCQKVFDYPIDKIVLRFNGVKLVGIYITTKKFQEGYDESGKYTMFRADDYENINSYFSYLFGKPTSVDMPEPESVVEVNYLWLGKKVILISRYEFLGILDGDRQQIIVADRTYFNKGIEDGF